MDEDRSWSRLQRNLVIGGLGAFWGLLSGLESPDPGNEPGQVDEPLRDVPERTSEERPLRHVSDLFGRGDDGYASAPRRRRIHRRHVGVLFVPVLTELILCVERPSAQIASIGVRCLLGLHPILLPFRSIHTHIGPA